MATRRRPQHISISANTQRLIILTQDPSITIDDAIAFAQVQVPAGELASGPTKHRVKVIDFYATSNVLYTPWGNESDFDSRLEDPYMPQAEQTSAVRRYWGTRALSDLRLHAQHCYAIAIRALVRFEFAHGRKHFKVIESFHNERGVSTQRVIATLRRMHLDESTWHVSHEMIYNAIYAYPRGELRKQLIALLRQGKSSRRPRAAGEDRRGRIAQMLSIHVRPPEVDDRLMPGHWEGDLIKGAGNQSAVGVLVERTTRLVLLCKMPDATAESALVTFTAKLNSIAAPLRQTLTYDQGKEMARHQQLSAATGIRVYFCDPHSPWQRGSCENTNGLLRQFLPKSTDLSIYSQDELDAIADLMNNRPRQTLDWRPPYQAFRQLIDAWHEKGCATIH